MCASPNQMVFRILAGRLDMFDTFDDEFGFQGRRLLSMKNTNQTIRCDNNFSNWSRNYELETIEMQMMSNSISGVDALYQL